jgi:hypothetical protein
LAATCEKNLRTRHFPPCQLSINNKSSLPVVCGILLRDDTD